MAASSSLAGTNRLGSALSRLARLLTVRYEEFLQHPVKVLRRIFAFIGVEMPAEFLDRLPPLKRHNFGKWQDAFTPEEKALIGPILHPLLEELGYARSDSWYRGHKPNSPGQLT